MQSKKYALVVGNGHYHPEAGVKDIPYTLNDARIVAKMLRHPLIGQFNDLDVTLVLDGPAWLIARKLEDLFHNKKNDNIILVYFSCHGYRDDQGELFLLSRNTRQSNLFTTSIPVSLIKSLMDKSLSRRQILILDTCFSGSFSKSLTKSANDNIPFEELSGTGRYVIASSTSIQESFPHADGKHSLFTYHLLEGITNGKADLDEDGLFAIRELFEYSREHVIQESQSKQTPKSFGLDVGGDIFVARNRIAKNPIVAEVKINTENAVSLIRDWNLKQFLILEGNQPSGKLITKPITTISELNSCYFLTSDIRDVASRINRGVLKNIIFVSEPGTGKTSMLSYFISTISQESTDTKVFQVIQVPSSLTRKDFNNALRILVGSEPNKYIAVFDGNILDAGIIELIQLIVEGKGKMRIWITCTLEQYHRLSAIATNLQREFDVLFLPGFIDRNMKHFADFIQIKLDHLHPALQQEILKQKKVTFRYLCDFYYFYHQLPETLVIKKFDDDDILNKSLVEFNALSLETQMLARGLDYFGQLSVNTLLKIIQMHELFSIRDYETLITSKFAYEDSRMLGLASKNLIPTSKLHLITKSKISELEETFFIEMLLLLGERETDIVDLASILQSIALIKDNLRDEHRTRFDQLLIRARNGVRCSSCNIYYLSDIEYCPTCGSTLKDNLLNNEGIRDIKYPLVPFPKPEFSKAVGRPKFDWEVVDFSVFNDLD